MRKIHAVGPFDAFQSICPFCMYVYHDSIMLEQALDSTEASTSNRYARCEERQTRTIIHEGLCACEHEGAAWKHSEHEFVRDLTMA